MPAWTTETVEDHVSFIKKKTYAILANRGTWGLRGRGMSTGRATAQSHC
jgi:hypothetical protein